MIWLLMGASFASTITVSSGNSIQTAINSATSGDTIEISTGIYSECLSFGGKNLDLVGVGSVTINGSSCSATATVSNAENISFSNLTMSNSNGYVIEADSTSSVVSLDEVSISNSGFSSQGPSDLGGVIYSTGMVLIDHSTFSGNWGGLGGVLYMEGGLLSLSNSTFSMNSGLKGGVLYARDGTIIESSNNEYLNNFTISNGFGGVFSLQYTVSYEDDGSIYEGNLSEGNAGVFYVNHNVGVLTPNEITVSNARFEDNGTNIVTTTSGKGGVFYVYNRSSLTITDSEFIDNESGGGGAIWVVDADDFVTIDNCLFDSNFSDGGAGGAIGVRGLSTAPTDLLITDSVFVDNSTDYAGGGAISVGTGALSQKYGSLTISGSSFQNNSTETSSSAHGGAVLVVTSSSDDVSITNTTFEGNSSFSSGGAIYIDGTDETSITLSSFVDNEASSAASYDHFGGGVFVNNASTIVLNNTLFCGNVVTQYISNSNPPTVKAAVGGAFYAQNVSDATVNNVVFQENSSEDNGGAIAFDAVDAVYLYNNTFVGNEATNVGAGFWLFDTSAILLNNLLTHSTGSGGYSNSSADHTYGGWFQNSADVAGSLSVTIGIYGHVSGDPQYQNYTQNGDCSDDLFMLEPSSPFVNAGDPNPGMNDGDGTRADIGAFGGPDLEDSDNDGYSALIDCNDNDPKTYPGAAFNESLTACREDADGDGYGAAEPSSPQVNPGGDCDDTSMLISPAATEFCDEIDNDCNGLVDDSAIGGSNYYADVDDDGYGSNTATQLCELQSGYVETTGDCNDLDPYVYPGAAENDSTIACMQDHDQDGWGDSAPTTSGIMAGSDCDDTNQLINPNAAETPADGFDSNCDGNEECYADLDLDGFGGTTIAQSASLSCIGLAIANSSTDCDDSDYNAYPGAAENDSTTACMLDVDGDGFGSIFAPLGGVGGNDCDDNDSSVYFGAPEIPGDGISQDCDNQEDCYVDVDGDGFGVATIVVSADRDCDDIGEAGNMDDCDDTDAAISPSASEIPYDETDNDCNTSTLDDDLDGDGYGLTDGDCNDEDVTVNPGQEEVYYDDIDNDCNPDTVDDDQDGDGLGLVDGDCDDTNPDINPNATDIPDDGIDQDCDGVDATEDTDTDTDTDTNTETETGIDTDTQKNDDGCGSSNSEGAIAWLGLMAFLLRRRRDV